MMISPDVRPVVAPHRIRWDDPPCPLCDGDRRSPVLEAPDLMPGGTGLRFAVVRCDECGLQFTSPRPALETIYQFYHSGIFPNCRPNVIAGTMTLVDVLEHAHDPLGMLADARRQLPPDGRLIVTVPNIDSTAYRWFGAAWSGLDLPRHLTHFTSPTLQRILERAGFRVTSLRQVGRPDRLRSSVMTAIRTKRATVWQRPLTVKPIAQVAAWVNHFAGKSDELIATAEVG